MFEKEAIKDYTDNLEGKLEVNNESRLEEQFEDAFIRGAICGYNKAKEETQKQDYSLFNFVVQYENGKFKCKYKSGKVFESVDGETWKENCTSRTKGE